MYSYDDNRIRSRSRGSEEQTNRKVKQADRINLINIDYFYRERYWVSP